MTDPIALIAALDDPNVRAFLRMLRHGEGTSDEAGYRRMFGGKLFESFADHPRDAQTHGLGGKSLTSTAAGAYQFLSKTWDGLVKQYGFADFSPKNQDLAAVALIKGRTALDDVIAGRFEIAVGKCAREWASLPGSPYGQPVISMAKAKQVYEAAGGRYAPAISATANSEMLASTTEETPVLPIAIPLIAGLAGHLIDAFAPLAKEKISKELARHSDRPEVVQQVTSGIIEAAKAITGKADPIDAVAAVKADPAALQQVETSTLAELERLAPMLDRLAALDREAWAAEESSRSAAAARAAGGDVDLAKPLVRAALNFVWFAGFIVLGLAGMQLWKTGEVRGEVLVLLGAFVQWAIGRAGDIFSYRFGTSRSSGAKDVLIDKLSTGKKA